MKRWLDIIEKGFPVFKTESANQEDLSFSIIESVDENTLKIEKTAEKGICFSWQDNENSFLAAVIEDSPCEVDEIQDKLEIIFDHLFGKTSSELYAARNVVIDDMFGLEVLGGNHIDDTTYDIFYGLYLSGEEKSYVIIGFGNDEVENVFEKLTGLSRLFYRKPAPALIDNGKSSEEEIISIRNLSKKLMPNINTEWQILNCTFYIKDGKLDNNQESSYLLLSKDGIEEMDYDELYVDMNIDSEILSLISNISPYDISGFTVTLFKDKRYSITYYPYDDEESDIEHDHSHDESCTHEHYYEDEDNDYFPTKGSEKEYALSYMNNLHARILEPVPAWNNGMVIIQNTENFTMVYPYYNVDNKPYTEINIVENLSENFDEESYMEELGTEYGKYYPAMYDYFGERVDDENLFTVLFSFVNNGNNEVDEKSLLYKEFSFLSFTTVEDMNESSIAINLLNILDELEQYFIEKPYCYIYMEFEMLNNNISIKEICGYFKDFNKESITSKSILTNIKENVENLFKENIIGNNLLKLIIFPNGKIGILK